MKGSSAMRHRTVEPGDGFSKDLDPDGACSLLESN